MPNPRLLQTASRLTRKGFGIKNRLLMPYKDARGDATLYVLKQNKSSTALKPFKLLAAVQNFGMDTERTQFRNRPFFEVSETESVFGEDNDKHFGQIIGVATHLAVVPEGEMFALDQGDEYRIVQTDFTYQIFAFLTGEIFDPETDV